MSEENILTIDKQVVKDALALAIKTEATRIIANATASQDIAGVIRAAFLKKWGNDKDNWLEASVRECMHDVLWKSVKDVISASGVESMIKAAVSDYVATPEFSSSIKARAIQAVKSTAYLLKSNDDDV